ncbi:rhomboid family intramembrane serine protease [Corynebacterium sp. MSK218]|uniref:rhomboid family intramembrane serine protease n=1 Tax=Corynebacterium sp. MSK218 TaxID=3050218 RepID=UPI00254E605B|nr:rhomboid family intramembrane serine protease [Corynebacterium sp. MSK218]MDK8764265.1 rhomboid family intramembrane serine protease [Corynebacterium sp. MSK218]
MKNYLKSAPATLVLMVLCIGAWLATAIQARSLSTPYYLSTLAQDWTLWGPEVSEHPITVITAGFMHLDAGHLLVNMVMLLFVGREVERALGSALYVAAYLVSIVGSSAAVLWMDFGTPTVGASGALFALMGLLIGVYRSRGLDLRAPIVLVVANVIYSFVAENVSVWGHLGGLLTGLLLAPFLFRQRTWLRWLGIWLIAVVVAVLAALRAGLWG